jgi:hypothetical protein
MSADAAQVLMATWDEMFPDRKPRFLQPRTPINHPFVEVQRVECQIGGLNGSSRATI